MPKKIELIARLLIVDQRHVLLTRKKGRDYTYLVGGHIEMNESAHAALRREMEEEFHGRPLVGPFMGAVESVFDHGKKHHHEINLLFRGQLQDYRFPRTPESLEPDIEFLWAPVDRLEDVNLLPLPIRTLAARDCDPGREGYWASTIEPNSEEVKKE